MIGNPAQKCITSEIHYTPSVRSSVAPQQNKHHTKEQRTHLLLDVIKRIRRVYSEANEDNMRVRIAQGSEPVIVLLPRRIPQRQLDMLPINLHIRNVILKHSRDVHLPHTTAPAHTKDESHQGPQRKQEPLTSGNVPFENTISRQVCAAAHIVSQHQHNERSPSAQPGLLVGYTHLPTGTVSNDNELPPDFSHGGQFVAFGMDGRAQKKGKGQRGVRCVASKHV